MTYYLLGMMKLYKSSERRALSALSALSAAAAWRPLITYVLSLNRDPFIYWYYLF